MRHGEAFMLLPWYLNATLSDSERREVEAHLADCPECIRALDTLRRMETLTRGWAEDIRVPDAGALSAVFARIDAASARREGLVDRLRRAWDEWWGTVPTFARTALAIQMAFLIAASTLLFLRWENRSSFETVSGPAGPGAASGATLVVGFAEEAPEREIRRALVAVQGRIVSGPSALGLYTVEIPVPPDRTEQVAKVVEQLRKEKGVVRFVARSD